MRDLRPKTPRGRIEGRTKIGIALSFSTLVSPHRAMKHSDGPRCRSLAMLATASALEAKKIAEASYGG
jgi:hypothetical protein